MIGTTLAQWREWNGRYRLLPLHARLVLPDGEAPIPLFWDGCWQDASPNACVLESGKGGRYTIVGTNPASVIVGKGQQARILEPAAAERTCHGAPLALVRKWLAPWTAPMAGELPVMCGGAIGYWSYDIVRSLEKLPELAADDLRLPDYVFMRFEQLWIVDQQERTVTAAVHADTGGVKLGDEALARLYDEAGVRAAEMLAQWQQWRAVAAGPAAGADRLRQMQARVEREARAAADADVEARIPGLRRSMSQADYERAVSRIHEYIARGDIFQANLAVRQSVPADIAPEALYEWLRLINPSPYMGLIRTPEMALVSASPELLVKLDGGKLSTRPIAGTRRRGRTPEEDAAMEAELLSSEKERAEHVMLVDLERNDLGRVAAYGSVRVPELMTVERYSHVMHLVSQVEARLAPGKDAFDVMAGVFPGGTITGAPKVRTMEIIEELEPTRRGTYTGSMGWIDYAGNMEFNILIRTVVHADGKCHIQAGAGIVIDSDPYREYRECMNKARALWTAVRCAQEGTP